MASKQQIAKENQGYIEKPEQRMCSNCLNFKSEKTYPDPKWPNWYKEKLTCSIGEFSVKKQANCNLHVFNPYRQLQ